MKEVPSTKYECGICRKQYFTEEAALGCESKPLSEDKGVKIVDNPDEADFDFTINSLDKSFFIDLLS
jgi:hypothetical protein